MKVANNQGKWLLKKMMHGILPDDVIYRKKMGFPTPMKLMLQRELGEYAKDILTSRDSLLNDFFCRKAVARLLEEHATNRDDHHRTIWQLIVLEQWLRHDSSYAVAST